MPGTWGRVRRIAAALFVASAVALGTTPAIATDEHAEPPPADTTTTTAPAEDPPSDPDPEPDPDPDPRPDPKPDPKIKFKPVKRYKVVRRIVFPVVGPARYHSGFGDCRDNCRREHHGVDIFTYGWKGQPIVAAHDGVVTKVTYDEGNPGCSVRIRGRDRWETRYYHLNNDFPGTDEIGAPCPAPGVEVGAQVVAGQIIGYMGDSGNAETTPPHLHFELRNRSGYPIDPYPSLRKARKVTFEWLPTDPQAATTALAQASYPNGTDTAIVMSTATFESMTEEETGTLTLEAPVIAIDLENSSPAIEELRRLAPRAIVVADLDTTHVVEQLVRPLAPIVDTVSVPTVIAETEVLEPDTFDPEPNIANPDDRFVTVVTGVVDRIYRSRKPHYEQFSYDHNVIVLTTEKWAPRGVGTPITRRLSRYADRSLFWWHTADGWVGTETFDEPPHPGIAYVTERRIDAGTVGFLGSLAELAPYPVWR